MGLVESLRTLKVFADAGLARPALPSQLIGMGLAFARWGITPAGGWAVGSARYPNQPALIDELGTLTFAEVDEMSSAIAAGLVDRGIRAGSAVGILARNSRWVGLSLSALGKAGADAVLLNTGFAAPQLADVVEREQIRAVIADAEFAPAVAGLPGSVPRIVAWQDAAGGQALPAHASGQALPAHAGGQALPGTEASWAASLADSARDGGTRLSRPDRRGRQVLLTSGTTGTPKGAEREVGGPEPGAALLSAIPLRARQTTYIASPVFHAWGLSHLGIGLLLSSTIVLRRRFDPEETLRLVEQHGVHALVVVPVMLARLLDLPEPVRRRYDLSTLRVVAVSGAALPAELALRFMDAFGDIVYNLYGTTEVAYASVAGPADLRAAPGTAGRPLPGAVVRIVDAQGRELPRSEVGRIFVGNSMPFSGLHQRRGQGAARLPRVHRRPRLPGPEGTAVRRRTQRRHDRLWWRKRLPGRGGGPAGSASRRGRGSSRRRPGRADGPAASRVRRAAGSGVERGGPAGACAHPAGQLQGAARGALPRCAAPQRGRQGRQAGARGEVAGASRAAVPLAGVRPRLGGCSVRLSGCDIRLTGIHRKSAYARTPFPSCGCRGPRAGLPTVRSTH